MRAENSVMSLNKELSLMNYSEIRSLKTNFIFTVS